MNNSILWMMMLQIVLILFNAVFACAEIAVISMNDTKLMKMAAQGNQKAMNLQKLTQQPARFLATIQVAITLSGFLGSAFAADNFSGILTQWVLSLGVDLPFEVVDSIALILITLILSYFTLVFGELVPKQIAMRKADSLALGLSTLLIGISKIFAPIVHFLTFSTHLILKLLHIDPNAIDNEVSEEEIRMMVDVGSEKGTIDLEERFFIQNVFEFDDLSAEDILTHRRDIIMLELADSVEKWNEIIMKHHYAMLPICDESVDRIIGILNTKKYFRLQNKTKEIVMKEAVQPAYFVPETIKLDILFKNMKKGKYLIAVVLDEYGGVSGIITIHDLIEKLVGIVDDEEEEVLIERVDETCWKIQGSALLEDISKELNVSLDCDEYDTLNGLIFNILGNIPADDTKVELQYENLLIQVLQIKDYQVESAYIRLISDK